MTVSDDPYRPPSAESAQAGHRIVPLGLFVASIVAVSLAALCLMSGVGVATAQFHHPTTAFVLAFIITGFGCFAGALLSRRVISRGIVVSFGAVLLGAFAFYWYRFPI